MTTIARVFMSGRSQAVRLPARLRLQAQEVRIEQIGNAYWMQPHAPASANMGEWLRAFYAQNESMPADFMSDRHDPAPEERDWT